MLKRIVLSLLILLGSLCLHAQGNPDYKSIRLDKPSDYEKADSAALGASKYLLNTPVAKDDVQRSKSMQFMIRWMEGTPDYTFNLDGLASRISGYNVDIIGIYLASMVKFCLENKEQSKNQRLLEYSAVKTLLSYCSLPTNGVKIKGELKKLKEAENKGQLEKYLDTQRGVF